MRNDISAVGATDRNFLLSTTETKMKWKKSWIAQNNNDNNDNKSNNSNDDDHLTTAAAAGARQKIK